MIPLQNTNNIINRYSINRNKEKKLIKNLIFLQKFVNIYKLLAKETKDLRHKR